MPTCALPPAPVLLPLAICPQVEAVGIPVGIGSNPPQLVCLGVSTVVNNTLVMGKEVCKGDQNTTEACAARRGGLFDRVAHQEADHTREADHFPTLPYYDTTTITLASISSPEV